MNTRDASGMTPLRLAAKEGHQDVSYNLQRCISISNCMSIGLHANLQVVLKLMKKRLQQVQPAEEVDAGVPVNTSDGVSEQPCDPTEALSQTELPTKLWALQYGISTYFEVTGTCGNAHAMTTCTIMMSTE